MIPSFFDIMYSIWSFDIFDLNVNEQALVVIQDVLRVFIVRVACQRPESASKLLRPIFSCIHDHISDVSPSDVDAYKVILFSCL